jgi:hypothetical protein
MHWGNFSCACYELEFVILFASFRGSFCGIDAETTAACLHTSDPSVNDGKLLVQSIDQLERDTRD